MKKTWRENWRAAVKKFCRSQRRLMLQKSDDIDWTVVEFEARIQYACHERMERDGLSQRALAAEVGIAHGPLGQFLGGRRTLRVPTAAKLCNYLGLEIIPIDRP